MQQMVRSWPNILLWIKMDTLETNLMFCSWLSRFKTCNFCNFVGEGMLVVSDVWSKSELSDFWKHCFEVISHLHMTIFINWLTRSAAAGTFECFLVAGIHYELSLLFPKSSFINGLISDDNLTMAKNSWWNWDFIKLQWGKNMLMSISPDTILGMTGYRSEWNERLGNMRQLSG